MRTKLKINCSDINTPYCPCFLANINHCDFCSHLHGGETCDCNWSGICILYEKQWQSKANLRSSSLLNTRVEIDSCITRKELIAKNTFILEFAVPSELALELKKAGAFVFLRKAEDPQFFHFPVGIMKVNENVIQVAIECVGPKTRRLLEPEENDLVVRGPYYNGVFGQPWIDNITYGKILLVAGGMGQAPALPLAEKLISNQNEVIAVLAPGRPGRIFIDKDLREMGVQIYEVDSLRYNGLQYLDKWFTGDQVPDLVVSSGPDEQHFGVIAAMQNAGVNLPLVATNNATMCCGEGICGSCECETQDNQMIRVCKVQADFASLAIGLENK